MSEVVVLSSAEAHVFRLYDKFEDRREGMGDEFDADFRRACVDLELFPEIGRRIDNRMRRLFLRHWHLGLYYVVETDRVVIHGVLDVRQSPDNIRRQLGLI